MATPVKLPELGESVTEGTVTRWLKSVGDEVEVDEPLLEVSTDKVDTEIPSPVAGTLLEIKVDEDETVDVGTELAVIGDSDEGGGSDEGSDDTSDEEAGDEDSADGKDDEDSEDDSESADEEPKDSGEDSEDSSDEDDGDQQPEEEEAPAEKKQSGKSSGSGGGTPVKLPELGESVTEGTVTRWLKSVGDEVEVDEPLLEVSTDKVDTEIPSPVAGTLLEIKVDEDETVDVGTELAIVGDSEAGGGEESDGDSGESDGGERDEDDKAAAEADKEPEPDEKPSPVPEPEGEGDRDQEQAKAAESKDRAKAEKDEDKEAEQDDDQTGDKADKAEDRDEDGSAEIAPEPAPQPAKEADGQAYVTPLVRKLANEHGVDLADVDGTGVGGRIRKQDVLDAAKAAKEPSGGAPASEPAAQQSGRPAPSSEPSPLRGRTEPLSRLRKVIAKRMVESLQVSAQLTTVVEVDVTAIARLRESVKADFEAKEGVKLSFMPFFVKAAIDALKAHPALNAGIDTDKGEVTYYDYENIAVAVDTEKGLLTPVIKNAGDLNVAGLTRHIADLAKRTRANKIGPDELSGGTFTVTNTGSRGALFDTPIINQPQVAILGTGTVVKRAVVIDDANLGETIAVRNMVYLSLTYDHRLVDGADAARFLSEVKERLEAGQFEV